MRRQAQGGAVKGNYRTFQMFVNYGDALLGNEIPSELYSLATLDAYFPWLFYEGAKSPMRVSAFLRRRSLGQSSPSFDHPTRVIPPKGVFPISGSPTIRPPLLTRLAIFSLRISTATTLVRTNSLGRWRITCTICFPGHSWI